MKKLMLGLILTACILMTGIFLGRNLIAKFLLEKTGIIEIESVKIDILNTNIEIGGLKLLNPGGFEDKLFIEVPRLYIDYNLLDIGQGRMYFNKVSINLKEVNVIKDISGQLNINQFEFLGFSSTKQRQAKKKEFRFRADEFIIEVGEVVYIDYTDRKNGAPNIKRFKINTRNRLTNVRRMEEIIFPILNSTIYKAAAETIIDRFLLEKEGED